MKTKYLLWIFAFIILIDVSLAATETGLCTCRLDSGLENVEGSWSFIGQICSILITNNCNMAQNYYPHCTMDYSCYPSCLCLGGSGYSTTDLCEYNDVTYYPYQTIPCETTGTYYLESDTEYENPITATCTGYQTCLAGSFTTCNALYPMEESEENYNNNLVSTCEDFIDNDCDGLIDAEEYPDCPNCFQINSTGYLYDVTSNDCCDAKTDCVYNSICYNQGSFRNIDTNEAVCHNGVWYDPDSMFELFDSTICTFYNNEANVNWISYLNEEKCCGDDSVDFSDSECKTPGIELFDGVKWNFYECGVTDGVCPDDFCNSPTGECNEDGPCQSAINAGLWNTQDIDCFPLIEMKCGNVSMARVYPYTNFPPASCNVVNNPFKNCPNADDCVYADETTGANPICYPKYSVIRNKDEKNITCTETSNYWCPERFAYDSRYSICIRQFAPPCDEGLINALTNNCTNPFNNVTNCFSKDATTQKYNKYCGLMQEWGTAPTIYQLFDWKDIIVK